MKMVKSNSQTAAMVTFNADSLTGDGENLQGDTVYLF